MGLKEEGEEEESRKDSKNEKKRTTMDSLGWLTESSIMPRKHRAIEGVGPSSILELKAQLYHSQQESKKSKQLSDVDYHRAKTRVSLHDPFSNKNSGVDSRALKDKLELKAINDGSVSYTALEKKAQLYEKLVKGELSDEEDKEKYCVDFFRKGVEQEDSDQPRASDGPATAPPADKDGESELFFNMKVVGLGRTAGTVDRDEHKRFVSEVHEEANKAREKASELKVRRQELAAARREKLKQAYLRKQLEKLKSASNSGHT